MEKIKIISGENEKEIEEKLSGEMNTGDTILRYDAEIRQKGKKILLDIDIDPGGGFESGFATTTFSAELHNAGNFRFAIHHESFLRDVGKLLGMEDIKIGYPAFDKKVIIKSNDKERIKQILSDARARVTISTLSDFTFKISEEKADNSKKKAPVLNLSIYEGITEPARLAKIYHAFYAVLNQIESEEKQTQRR